jgi:hypothetical protein
MLQHPPLSLTVMTKNLSPNNLAILGTHYIKELLMKRGKRENLVGNPPSPPKEEKNVEWPKLTYSAVSTTPSMALSSKNLFSVKELVKMSVTCCSMGQYCNEMTLSWISSRM